MAMRMLEVLVPADRGREAWDLLQTMPTIESWRLFTQDELSVLKVVLDASHTEAVLDVLEGRFANTAGFRVVVFPIDAVLPRHPDPEDEAQRQAADAAPEEQQKPSSRISRQEMYEDISAAGKVSREYMAMVVLSSVVASVGLLRDSVALVIGAMVLAPLLGPNMALALATCLGDGKLGRRAMGANASGVALALVFSVGLGALVQAGVVSPEPGLDADELLSRTEPKPSDIVLALAAGCAGALAFTGGVSATLIGVMVAVALLPPLVTFGMLLGAGQVGPAWGALVLLVTNVACVNLAAIGVFLSRGIRPRTWWEGRKAVKATRWALSWWSLLLAVLAVAIWRLVSEV